MKNTLEEDTFSGFNSSAIVFNNGRESRVNTANMMPSSLKKSTLEVQSRSRIEDHVLYQKNRSQKRFPRDRSAESHVVFRTYTTQSQSSRAELSFVGQDCHRVPSVLGKLYGPRVKTLDLSYNCLTTLAGVEQFALLEELVLDNNQLTDGATFPSLPNLHTLSLNKNCINNLDLLLIKIRNFLPALRYLSLLGNKACPNQLSDHDKDDEDYQRYRYYVLHHLPNLNFLDSRHVDVSERKEALQRGQFMRIMRPVVVSKLQLEDTSSKNVYTPLPSTRRESNDHQGAYGKCRYRYSGKHSEGNRFIQNSDL